MTQRVIICCRDYTPSASSSQPVATSSTSSTTSLVSTPVVQRRQYAVAQALGGGTAAELAATLSASFGVSLVPWGAVAADVTHMESGEQEAGQVRSALCTATNSPLMPSGLMRAAIYV